MTAPERIWLQDGGDFDAASEVTWCQHSIDDADTEYVRADLAAVPAQVRVKPLADLVEEFTTAVWHLMDNSETSGPIEDPTITVWQPDFDTVCGLLDRIEGLPSGSTDDMTAGELLSVNILAALDPQPDPRDAVIARLVEALEFYADMTAWTQPPVKTREGLLTIEYENQASKMQKDRGAKARAALAAAKEIMK